VVLDAITDRRPNCPAAGIGDALHSLTAGLNSYFARNNGAANALLIVSSGLIDALGLFLLDAGSSGKRSTIPRLVPAYGLSAS